MGDCIFHFNVLEESFLLYEAQERVPFKYKFGDNVGFQSFHLF